MKRLLWIVWILSVLGLGWGLWKWKTSGPSYSFVTQWGLGGDVPGWFDLPEDVAVDRRGSVYVADFHNERVQRFDLQGKFLGILASFGPALGEVKYPRALAVDGEGNLYVFEQGNGGRIQKFDPSGRPLLFFSKPSGVPSLFQGGADLTVAENGMIYVAEPTTDRVEEFSPEGKFLKRWGGPGNGPGQFDGPFGIAADGAGHLYVSEVNNDRVQKFDLEGNFLAAWGKKGNGPGEFDHPNKMACDGSYALYVADSWNHRVQKFDPEGKWLASFGSQGREEGQLDTPYGLDLGPEGKVYVADTGNDRIVVFKPR